MKKRYPIPYESLLGIVKLKNGYHQVEVVFRGGYSDNWFLQYNPDVIVEVVKWGWHFGYLYEDASEMNRVKK